MSDKNIDWEKLEKYLAGDHSLLLNHDELEMVQLMSELKENRVLLGAVANTDPKAAWEKFQKEHLIHRAAARRISMWKRLAIAATITGIIGITGLWLVNRDTEVQATTGRIVSPEVDKVTLLMPDNSSIVIDTAGAIRQGMVHIDFEKESARFSAGEGASEMAYNTILVPRGKKFNLTLEDGTRVWLNADSKLRFPARFNNEAREVELDGEAYFDVVHFENRPFTVRYSNKSVRVLGTRFNINAYNKHEAVTLLQGKVQWNGMQQSVILQPGQQVLVNGPAASDITTRNVKAEDYILWINNTLLLEQKSVRDLFDDIVRHYDIDVQYKAEIPDSIKFNGAFEFPPTLDQMLSLMNSTGKVKAEKLGDHVLVTLKTR